MPFVVLYCTHSSGKFNYCTLIVAFSSHGIWQERHLFNQQLPVTVPHLGASCCFCSQMVQQRDMSLIEIQETDARSSSQPGTAAAKMMT